MKKGADPWEYKRKTENMNAFLDQISDFIFVEDKPERADIILYRVMDFHRCP